MIAAVGYLASFGSAVMWLPQAARAIRYRRDPGTLAGISIAAYATAVVFNALLLTYGLRQHADPVVLAGLVNLVCALVIVTVVRQGRKGAA